MYSSTDRSIRKTSRPTPARTAAPPTASWTNRQREVPEVRLAAAPRRPQQAQEHDDPDAVVEQGLARDLHLQRPRDADPLEQPEHGDRVGGGDQGAEQQAVDGPDGQAEQGEHPPRRARRRSRSRAARRRWPGPRSASGAGRGPEVHVERPGEEQEPEHPVKEGLVEVELGQQPSRPRPRRPGRKRPATNTATENSSVRTINPIAEGSLSTFRLM